MREDTLIASLKEGDENAFWELQKLYRQRIYRLAFSVVKDSEDALDVCQNVLLKMWQRIHYYEPRPDKSFWAWLGTVTMHESRNYIRNNHRRYFPGSGTEPDDIADPQRFVLDEAEKSELGELLEEVMEVRLTHREHHFMRLKHQEELTYQEISEREHCAIGTVKSTVSSAVKKMTRGLVEKGIHPQDYCEK